MSSALQRFRHIVVEGPIGVGKSSLATRLARHLGAELLLEQPEENPFLQRFYADMPGYAFQTQLSFLFQRLRQMQALAQPSMFSSAVVSDFLFAKDAIFAGLNLSDDEHRLYQQMYGQLVPQIHEPDLVLWLQAAPATLLQRVRKRAVAMEQGIELGYLQRVVDAYASYFHGYDGAPVYAVATEHFNPAERDADFAVLVERLAAFRGRREFFNSQVEATLS